MNTINKSLGSQSTTNTSLTTNERPPIQSSQIKSSQIQSSQIDFEKIKYLLEKDNTTYRDLRKLLPENWSEEECVNKLRVLSALQAIEILSKAPKKKQKERDTVETIDCKWHDTSIKLVGFLHGIPGIIGVNQVSKERLEQELKGTDNDRILLVEENINPILRRNKLPTGQDVRDQPETTREYFKNLIKESLIKICLPWNWPELYRIHKEMLTNIDLLSPPYEKPDYSTQLRAELVILPENIEKTMYETLDKEPSVDIPDVDPKDKIIATNSRSAYMAGYIAACAKKSRKPITFACGGLHIPRIKTLLSYSSKDEMPKAFKKDFENGYNTALAHSKQSAMNPALFLMPLLLSLSIMALIWYKHFRSSALKKYVTPRLPI